MNHPPGEDNPKQHAGKYGNFRDPVGLLWRMLRSGNRAAYGALGRAAMSTVVTPIDYMLRGAEQRLLEKSSESFTAAKQVLIVGPPRSGSTLLYQTMAHYGKVSYPTNWTSLFSRSPILATQKFLGPAFASPQDFSSYYGQTAGWRSPNDAFEIWNRWLGVDRYSIPEHLNPDQANQLRRFFAAWHSSFQTPFLNKNNRNLYALRLLSEILPNAYFVVIRRDPMMVAQSLIRARINVQGSKHLGWGLNSSETHATEQEPLGYVRDVCEQLISIETKMCQQLAGLDKTRYCEIDYGSFCAEPLATLQQIAAVSDSYQLNENLGSSPPEPFQPSAQVHLEKEERALAEECLGEINASSALRACSREASSQLVQNENITSGTIESI